MRSIYWCHINILMLSNCSVLSVKYDIVFVMLINGAIYIRMKIPLFDSA
jgi:hypothetical protein